MSQPATEHCALRAVEYEYRRWQATITWPGDEPGLAAGTWSSSGPRHREYGMTVSARTPDRFREMAAALLEAAAEIDRRSTDAGRS